MSAQVLSFSDNSFQGLPPQNIEAEEAILGGILIDSNALERVVDRIAPEDFYVNANRLIFEAALELSRTHIPCDLMTISNLLSDRGQLEAIGGRSILVRLAGSTVSAINIDAIAEIIVEKAISRKLIAAGNEIVALGWNQTESLESRTDKAEAKIFAVSSLHKSSSSKNTPEPTSESVARVYSQFEAMAANGAPPSVATGFYDLDQMLNGGFYPGDLIVIGGRPSMGKSLLGCTLAYNIADCSKKPTLIFSLEMDTDSIIRRFFSNQAGIDSGRLRQGNIDLHEWDKVSAASSAIAQTPVFIDDSPRTSASEIRSKIRSMVLKHGELSLVVIDYLQMMVGGDEAGLASRIGEVTRQLKSIARECKVPIVLLSQLSRKVEERGEKRPKQSDLRDSGRIEEDADVILFPYRDEYYNSDTPDRGLMEIICTKHRNGATGTIKLLFDGTYSRLRNYVGGRG